MAELRMFEERRNLIIIVMLEEIDSKDLPRTLRTLIKHVTYLQWYNEEERRVASRFYKRLRLAIQNT